MHSIRRFQIGLAAVVALAGFLPMIPIAAQAADQPAITVTFVPACNTKKTLQGTVSGVVPADYKIAVYLGDSGWWNKPTWDKPLTNIARSGAWSARVVTADGDATAPDFAAFLVPVGYTPPSMSGETSFPAELYTNAAAYVFKTRHCDVREFEFSGYTWEVRDAPTLEGPGPNLFSDRTSDVYVDKLGRLHMKIVKRGGKWYSTEIINEAQLGYGQYVFHIASRLDQLDPNVVLGLFTYDESPDYNYREIDIEFSRWGDPLYDNSQFVIQPYTTDGNIERFNTALAKGQKSTHGFDWEPDHISFQSLFGDQLFPGSANQIHTWTYTGADLPPTGNQLIHINLWLADGAAPTNNRGTEVILDRFEFTPAP